MNPITAISKTNSDGVLELSLPLGRDIADQEVRITIEPVGPSTLSPEQWRQGILETAGKWQGDFRRPEQGEYEEREALS